ncbi:MAG: molybdenum cofactor biosynthesis protein B [Dehalococcoidales bacterium]
MGHKEHKDISPRTVNCAVLTISDSRTEATDESGRFIIKALEDSGHRVTARGIIRNSADTIGNRLAELLADDAVEVIITSGGTGASHRDVTVETVNPILEKKMDGFGELFRYLTYQEIGTPSIMSRALGGIARGKVILCLPGSTGAARLALEKIILPELGHLVHEANR